MSQHDRDETAGMLVTVELVGLPVEIHARAAEHGQELQRELTLVHHQLEQEHAARGDAAGSSDEAAVDLRASVPRRLVELIEALQGRYAGYSTEQEQFLDEAVETGLASVDVTYRVPPDVAEASVALGAMLDEADDYCREGKHLLTLATPPEALAYRRWYLEQFVDQVAGRPPRSWADWLVDHPIELHAPSASDYGESRI
jgi:hypothetical protein